MRKNKSAGACAQHERAPAIMAILWLGAAVIGLGVLGVFAQTAGGVDAPPTEEAAALPARTNTAPFRLVVAVHPKCPCTSATIGQIERILADAPGRLTCTVLAYQPAGAAADWLDTKSIRTSRERLGAEVIADADGAMAQRLGMSVSGSVVLYSPEGTAEFFGGLTSARGHEGDSSGKDAVTAIVLGKPALYTMAPVYGCRIGTESADDRQ